jgi:proteic killer suppression protein
MIRSFGDKRAEALFRDEFVRQFQGIARVAKRKLEALNAASRLEDLTVPPSNRLEKLKGDLKDFHSIRVNDQWRVIFKWDRRRAARGPDRGLPLVSRFRSSHRRAAPSFANFGMQGH